MSFLGLFSFNNKETYSTYSKSSHEYLLEFPKGYFRIDKDWLHTLEAPFVIYHLDSSGAWNDPMFSVPSGKRTEQKVNNLLEFKNNISSSDTQFCCGVVFDEQNNTVHIARDVFGKLPVYHYYKKGEFLAFSSDLSLILSLKPVKASLQLNHHAIYKYLSITHESKPYSTQTFYRDIFSALPGCVTSFSTSSYHSKPYVVYNPRKWEHLTSTTDFGIVLADLLKKSVSRSIQDISVIGAQLSGGLDSSSISCLTKYLQPKSNLHTFYCDTESLLGDERKFADEVAHFLDSTHHIIKPSQNDLEELIYCTSLYKRPEHMALSPSFQISMIKAAKKSNCELLLTGHDGDSIIGSSRTYLPELFLKKDWDNLKINLTYLTDRNNFYQLHPNWPKLSVKKREKLIFSYYFNKEILGAAKSYNFQKALNIAKIGVSKFHLSTKDFFIFGVKSLRRKISQLSAQPISIHSTFLKDYILEEIDEASNIINSPTHQSFYDDIIYTQNIRINEEYFALSKSNNILIRHPFFDKDLYELCLAVPHSIKFGEGLGRGHLRNGMKDYLPPSISTRRDKALFNTYSSEAAIRLIDQGQDFLAENSYVWDFVDHKSFQKAATLLRATKISYETNNMMTFFVNRTIFLSVWLNQISKL